MQQDQVSPIRAEEFVRMLEGGDLYGLFVRVGRMWLAKDHPEAKSAATVVDFGRKASMLQVPIIPCESEGAEPFLLHTSGPTPR
jgi:hypothetical protein